MYFLGPLGSKGMLHIYIHISGWGRGVATPLQPRVVSGVPVVPTQLLQIWNSASRSLQPESCALGCIWVSYGFLIKIDTSHKAWAKREQSVSISRLWSFTIFCQVDWSVFARKMHSTTVIRNDISEQVCDKVVWQRRCVTKLCVCERWCVTKLCVKESVWQSCVWRRRGR